MDAFADADALVPIADLALVMGLAARASERPDFGLLIADRAQAHQAGSLGEMFRSADDLRAALHNLIRYFHLNTRGVIFHHMRAFLGDTWRPIEVLLSQAKPAGAAAYRRFFGVPVRFDALCAGPLFSADDLARPMIGREREKRRLEAAADPATSKLDISLDAQVRWTIRSNLGYGKMTIVPVAHALGMSRPTLNRQMAESGVTFATFATARQLLVESGTPLAEIATAVGYGEASAFSSAFRSWSGVSPSECRRQHGRS